MQPIVLQCSEKFVSERKKLFFSMRVILPVLSATIIYLLGREEPLSQRLATLAVGLSIIGGIVMFLPRMLKDATESVIRISEDGIERISGTRTKRMPFSEISRVVLTRDGAGKTSIVTVRGYRGMLQIFGYDNLDLLVNILYEKIDASKISPLKAVDWKHLLRVAVFLALFVLCSLAVASIQHFTGLDRDSAQGASVLLSVALLTFMFNPVSETWGTRFRKAEVIGSSVLTVSAIALLLGAYLLR